MSGVSSRAQPGADIERQRLGERIAQVVERYDTKSAAARAAGITAEQLNKWIKGTVKVPVDGCRALAEGVGADLSWLITGEPQPQPQPQAQTGRQAALSPLPAETGGGVLATLASAAAALTFDDVAGGVALAVLFTAGLWVAYGTGLAMCGGCW
ncbi:hypothetical protein NHN26_16895 [Rhodovulum tesquicola]|uniref:hypothetical protein n=1 Tax=Rhodovulum tesquicola TaxID=540254 RepID=UPI0020970F9F|nr:hypothetical protein [Rhodovulum tesquicola]MCO8146883.1 hypothetical protein [Rhodovulum tesquicola]